MCHRAIASSWSPKQIRLPRDARVDIDIGEAAEARGGIGGADELAPPSPFVCLFIYCSRFVRVENAFEMVHLMLKNVREEIRCAAREALSMFIICPNGRFLGARHSAPESPYRKAPLVLLFFRTRYFCEFRIYIHFVGGGGRSVRFFAPFVRSIPSSSRECATGDDEKTHRLADLPRRERNAVFLFSEEGPHFFNQTLNVLAFYVGNANRLRFFPQCRVIFLGQNRSH